MAAKPLDQLCVNTIRTLAMDAVQKANSGHPGMPMGMADVAYVLWTRFLRHNPANPAWPNRDRFVLSAGHGSMLLYSLLHLTGYPLPLEVPAAAANLWYDGVLPLPCARLRLEPDAWWWPLAEEVLREEKLEWHQLRVPGLDRPYFSRGERRLSFRPEQWKHEFADDELNPQRRKLLLQFDLPRGSYATIVVKGIMAAARAGETPRR